MPRFISHFCFPVALSLLLVCGASIAAAQSAAPAYVFPIMAPRLSSKYGMRHHPIYKVTRKHHGLDLAAPKGTPVRVITAGKVLFAGSYAGYGKLVTVRHAGGMISMYGHLDEILVNLGEEIKAGRVLGRVGSTGDSTGPHLHLEFRKNEKTIDPEKLFPGISKPAEG